ncbi:MAG: glycosyltransferase family 2 protein [Alphaproteobacteria bacterium]
MTCQLNKHPLITIGIATFNAQDSIHAALDSAIVQDWPNFEIVIVDDASSDHTRHILQNFERQHSCVRVIVHEDNQGVAVVRNRIIQEACGAFIAFFDDDDVSAESRLRVQYKALLLAEEGSQCDALCHCARLQIYPDGVRHYEVTAGSDDACALPGGESMALRILAGKPVVNGYGSLASCSLFARKSVLKNIGYDPQFERSEDTDFTVRFALSGGVFVGIKDALVTQAMTYGDEKTLEMEHKWHLKLIDKHEGFIEAHVSKLFLKGWLTLRYYYLKGLWLLFLRKAFWLIIRHPVLFLKKVLWAFPNMAFNKKQKSFLGRGV